MRRVYQAASLVFLGLAGYVVLESRGFDYYTRMGPGPGFFPFWLGLLMALLSVVWFLQVSLRPIGVMESGFVPHRGGALRIASLLVALVLFTWLVESLGFPLTALAFALFLLIVLGRQNPMLSVAVSLAGSFGVYYVFRFWLEVQLPAGSIELLQNLGL